MKMAKIDTPEIQWFACRVKRKQLGGIRSVTVGGDFEAYRDRSGRMRKRRVNGTGSRVFLPEHLLRRAGFEVFLPVKKVLRRKNRFTPEKVLLSQPLLIDWVFVGWPVGENRWEDLMALDAVVGVLGTGGRPVSVPAARVAHLMKRWNGARSSIDKPATSDRAHELSPGDTARVVTGPLDGVLVRVIDMSGPIARAAVNILGGDVTAEIHSDLLQYVEC